MFAKNREFELFPHDPDIVDKRAWRSDLKIELPTPIFSATVFTEDLTHSADTGVRIIEAWTVPSSELLVAKFIFDIEEGQGRQEALERSVCLMLGSIATTAHIAPTEVRFTEFGITWMYDHQLFGAGPQDALQEIPPIHAAEVPHHSFAA